MNNRVLWRVYLEQVAVAVPAFWLMTYLWGNYGREVGDGMHYGRQSVIITGLVLAFVLGLTWHLMRKMRSDRECSFVNALPVTKGQQITALAGVMLLFTAVLTVIGEGQLCYFNEHSASLGEILLSIVVKTVAVFCVDGICIWIFSHMVPGAGGLLLWISGLVICLRMLDFLCDIFQKIFGVPGNRPLYTIWNLWCILTVPIQDYNSWGASYRERKHFLMLPSFYQKLLDVPVLTWGRKGLGIVLFVAVAAVLAFAFVTLARRNYQAGDLAGKRIHRPFRKTLEIFFVCALCSVCTGALGGFYLQCETEGGYDLHDISADEIDALEDYGFDGISGRDFRERRTYWGEEIYYPGAFRKYHYYMTSSSGFAKEFILDSVLGGIFLVLLHYAIVYRKRRGAN